MLPLPPVDPVSDDIVLGGIGDGVNDARLPVPFP